MNRKRKRDQKARVQTKCREKGSRVSYTDGVRDMKKREMKFRNKTSRNKEKKKRREWSWTK
jgi:hypothetical protein